MKKKFKGKTCYNRIFRHIILLFILVLLQAEFSISQAQQNTHKDSAINVYTRNGTANDYDPIGPAHGENEKIQVPDIVAKFIGGDSAFVLYVREKMVFPKCYLDSVKSLDVQLQFVVDTRGLLSEITVLNKAKLCSDLTKEFIQMLQKSPQWIPGMKAGRFVKSYRQFTIHLPLAKP
jgi:hypothetical protein